MNIEGLNQRLAVIRGNLEAREDVAAVSVRELLRWTGAERRGHMVAYRIKNALKENGVSTLPDFDTVHLDATVLFLLDAQQAGEAAADAAQPIEGAAALEIPGLVMEVHGRVEIADTAQRQFVVGAADEPAFRVSRLLAASQPPTRVQPDCTLVEAVTIMMRHDFSQLPVMTTEREVKGIVTWASIATRLQIDEEKPQTVQVCMVPHVEVPESESLFRVIDQIVEHSYVLVRGGDKTITGIVTATDLSSQFRQLSEPFLLLGEIENHLRSLIDNRFTADELRAAKDAGDVGRAVESVADLTLGEIIRLLESPENWGKIGVPLDRNVVIRDLHRVRGIRNDVMHFDPDGISPEDHATLFAFVQFLHDIRRLRGA